MFQGTPRSTYQQQNGHGLATKNMRLPLQIRPVDRALRASGYNISEGVGIEPQIGAILAYCHLHPEACGKSK